MAENNTDQSSAPEGAPPVKTNGKGFRLSDMGLAMIPVTPVKFQGAESVYAWGRLMVYGSAAALTWKNNRRTSYFLMGALGLSLVTSLAGNAWVNKENG